jgi:hypothetical protein
MSSVYPAELDTPTNMPNHVEDGDTIYPEHMNTQSDALLALEAKVGKNASTDPASHDRRITVLEAGGGEAAVFAYVHNQLSPSDVWTVNHGLHGYPNVTTVDSSGTQVEGDVDYVSGEVLTVTFSLPFGGSAYLS